MTLHFEQGDIPWVSIALALISVASALFAVYVGRRSKEITSGERAIIGLAISVASVSLFAMLLGLISTSGFACSHIASLC